MSTERCYLVLGGNGYLGSKVVRKLIENEARVICTKRDNSDLGRLYDIADKIIFIPATESAVRTVFEYERKIDWVLNLASSYSYLLYNTCIESNVTFPVSVLNTSVENGVTNFLTIGTSLPDNLNMYSFSKSILSKFGEFYCDNHKLNFYNVLLEMFYGSDEPSNRFIPRCIIKMIHGEDLDLTEGTQHRDLIAIEDVVDAIMVLTNSDLHGYNDIPLGTGEAPSIKELLTYIKQVIESKSKLNFGAIPMRKNETICQADTTIMKSVGFECKFYWKDGITKMINEIIEMEERS